MKNHKTCNTYQSITLWHYDDNDCHAAYIYTAVENVKLNLHLRTSYEQGKREMARLMLRLGKLPEVRYNDGFAVYDLHGFLD